MQRRPGTVLLLTALLALAGCSSSGPPNAGPRPTPTAHRTPGTLSPTLGAPVHLGAAITTPVLKGSTLFYAYSDTARAQPNRIASMNLTTRRRTVLVERSVLLGGTITAVALTGWPVYLVETRRGPTTPGRARWAVAALDPSTGQQTVLMEGGPDVQSPDITGGREATWVIFPSQGGARLKAYSWAPGQGAPRKADAMPGDASECTPPTPNQELVSGCSHQGSWWAWTEQAKPGQRVLDDPEYLYVAGPGTRRRIAHLGFAAAPPILIGGSLLWESAAGLEVTSLEHLGRNTLIARHGYFVGSTDGKTAAVVSESETGATARLLSTS